MFVRPYRTEDRSACLALFDSNTPAYFDPVERVLFEQFLDALDSTYFVLEHDGGIAGCGGWATGTMEEPDDRGVVTLTWGMVRQALHKRGYGSFLLRERLRLIGETSVPVVAINTSQFSAPFFARHGFIEHARVKDGYVPGIDRIDMTLKTGVATDPIEICAWSPLWLDRFREIGGRLRMALGGSALRIDHIGSTSIQGLPAKPIIDIQISVADFEPFAPLKTALNDAGYLWQPFNAERTKRYFRERVGAERAHVHMRVTGSWHQQTALLFRDYLRASTVEQTAYANLKHALALEHTDNRAAYTTGKTEHFWSVMRRADDWAKTLGWRPGPSDA